MAKISSDYKFCWKSAIFALLLTHLAHSFGQTDASGLGELLMHHEGTLLGAEYEHNSNLDSIFIRDDRNNVEGAHDERFAELVAKLRVDVVAPSKDLAKMMGHVSTKSRAMFLKDYERYFQRLEVGSVSRPMLMSYLGLEFATQDQIEAWYRPYKGRASGGVVESCRRLLTKRNEIRRLYEEADAELNELIRLNHENKLHYAHLTFKNNLNLFMLENYLLLCSRLESGKLNKELEKTQFLFQTISL